MIGKRRRDTLDPARYLDEFVDPTIAEYEAEPTSVRRAFLACVAVFHTVDYLAGGAKGNRKPFGQACPAFGRIDDIAHAFKHAETRPAGTDDANRLTTSAMIVRPPAYFGVAAFGLSYFGDEKGSVAIAGKHEFDVLADLKAAVAFLRSKISDQT